MPAFHPRCRHSTVAVVHDDEACAEFLCLDLCAPGEVLSRNTHGKSKIVFDAGTGARLAARTDRFEDQRIQALGGRIDCCGETGRPRADDNDVVDV